MPRRGTTLIEALVSMAIISILVGLLLSGVQAVRRVASRMSCQNNLKQIGLAAHMYHDVQGSLPAPPRVRAGNGNLFNLSWLPLLLPYLEQDAMWADVVADYRTRPSPYDAVDPHKHFATVLPWVGCPGDERTRRAWTIPDVSRYKPIAVSSYLGNAGTRNRARDGVIYKGAKTNLLHVTDGTSTTLLAGERPPSPEMLFGWWYAGAGVGSTAVYDMVMTVREPTLRPQYSWYRHCPDGPHHFVPRRLDDFCGVFQYWSVHEGGANFALCDGSVRFLTYQADAILPALATRAGGESAGLE